MHNFRLISMVAILEALIVSVMYKLKMADFVSCQSSTSSNRVLSLSSAMELNN